MWSLIKHLLHPHFSTFSCGHTCFKQSVVSKHEYDINNFTPHAQVTACNLSAALASWQWRKGRRHANPIIRQNKLRLNASQWLELHRYGYNRDIHVIRCTTGLHFISLRFGTVEPIYVVFNLFMWYLTQRRRNYWKQLCDTRALPSIWNWSWSDVIYLPYLID